MSTRSELWLQPPERFAAEALAARFAKLSSQAARCAATPDADAVHDLRVAIRRFSQALRIFRGLLDARAAKSMRRQLTRVMEAAAVVRDLDVGMERLASEGVPERHPILEEMRAGRARDELALRGRLLLLASREPERAWPPLLEIRAETPAETRPKRRRGAGGASS